MAERWLGLGVVTQLFYEQLKQSDSPYINHFIQPDTIVPELSNPQSWNRYSYVTNNPLRYTDPTGHMRVEDGPQSKGCSDPKYCQHGKPKPLEKDKPSKDKIKSDKNFKPDYYIASVFVPFIPKFPIPGFEISVVRDTYGNWYVTPGLGVSLGPSISGGAGWLLKDNNDHEYVTESFLQGHSFNVSGGYGLGVGVNNIKPLYLQTDNEGSKIEDISIEALGTSPGVSAVFSFGVLLYDKGDDTPWIWQGN